MSARPVQTPARPWRAASALVRWQCMRAGQRGGYRRGYVRGWRFGLLCGVCAAGAAGLTAAMALGALAPL